MNNGIYINHIMIFPNLGHCDVQLRNGLNVVWSKHCEKDNDDKEIIKIRNSVGKTTFIQFIDYLLGKTFFITKVDGKIEDIFYDKFLMAEVIFGNKKFTIRRSILENENIEVFNDWILSSLISDNSIKGKSYELNEYIDFLTENIYGEYILFNDKRYITHRQIMSFLIRDQYFGFTKFNSGIKDESGKIRSKRLDLLLGLISTKREKIEREIEELNKDKKSLQNEKNILKKYFQLLTDKTMGQLNKQKNKNVKNIQGLEIQLSKNVKIIEQLDEEKQKLIIIKNDLNKKVEILSEDIYILTIKVKDYKMTFKDMQNELYKLSNIKVGINILSPFEFEKCPVLMNDFKNETGACEYVKGKENKTDFNSMVNARSKILTFEKKDLEEAINKISTNIKTLKQEKVKVTKEVEKINKRLMSINETKTTEIDKVKEKIIELKHENVIIDKDIENFIYVDKLQSNIKSKNDDITEKKTTLSELSQSKAFDLSLIYNDVISFLTSNTRCGKINTANYTPTVNYLDGTVDNGSAMKNLAIIAFDIAILELSLKFDEVGNIYPKFLIHDSPKHHDLQLEIYNKIFDYIIKMENKYFKEGKTFQYIITTLDISKNVKDNEDIFVRLLLNDSGDGGKLFGCQVEI